MAKSTNTHSIDTDSLHELNKNTFFSDWLTERRKDTNFEQLPDTILAEILRQFFGEVRNKKGKPYSKSGMVNIRSGLNRYLQSPPHNRVINLMHNDSFQNANKVFTGVLRVNKQNGLDVRKPKVAISKANVEKLYQEYFIPGLMAGNSEILLHKVFFDIVYFMSRRAKEGLRKLRKDSFEFLTTPDGVEYIQIKYNEVTKKNQGGDLGSRYSYAHDNKNIILAQPGDVGCPVNSFRKYLSLLSDKIPDFFQRPSKNKTKFYGIPLGVHYIGDLMKLICQRAKLSRIHTNHEIRKTSATGMQKGGVPIPDIAHQWQHKDLQSLQHYLEQPTLEDKCRNAKALMKYTSNKPDVEEQENVEPPPKIPAIAPAPIAPEKENITAENAVIPFHPNFTENCQNEENPTLAIAPQNGATPTLMTTTSTNNSQVVHNQLRQAPVMFQGATFNNCTITLQVPPQ